LGDAWRQVAQGRFLGLRRGVFGSQAMLAWFCDMAICLLAAFRAERASAGESLFSNELRN